MFEAVRDRLTLLSPPTAVSGMAGARLHAVGAGALSFLAHDAEPYVWAVAEPEAVLWVARIVTLPVRGVGAASAGLDVFGLVLE